MKFTSRTLFHVEGGKTLGEASEVDQKISECVDAALKKLGEGASKSIYCYLEKNFDLKRFEIPREPEVFEKAIATIFGKRGAKMIEKLISVEIRNTFHLKKGSTSTFKESVKIIKNSWCIRKLT